MNKHKAALFLAKRPDRSRTCIVFDVTDLRGKRRVVEVERAARTSGGAERDFAAPQSSHSERRQEAVDKAQAEVPDFPLVTKALDHFSSG